MSGAVEATEMEHRVAKAISRDINQHQIDTGFAAPFDFPEAKGGLERDWPEYLPTARAAIRAMVRPTDAMLAAGVAADEELENAAPTTAVHIIYSDMIKAATDPIQESATAAVPLK